MTLQEIKRNIYTQIDNNSSLTDLTPSTMSVLKAIADCVAFVIYIYYVAQGQVKTDINNAVREQNLGTEAWYYRISKEFQYGDDLTLDPDTYQLYYDLIDVDKQIIKYVSVREIIDNNVTLLNVQVSKADKVPLTFYELNAFKSYLDQLKFAGVRLKVDSLPPTDMQISLSVAVDTQVITLDGSRVNGGSPVNDAITNYVDNIVYGGTFNRTACIDAVQAVEGVYDAVIVSVTINGEVSSLQNIPAENGAFDVSDISNVYKSEVL